MPATKRKPTLLPSDEIERIAREQAFVYGGAVHADPDVVTLAEQTLLLLETVESLAAEIVKGEGA